MWVSLYGCTSGSGLVTASSTITSSGLQSLIQRLDFNTDVRNIIIINFPLVFAQENLYSNRNLFISLDVSSYKRKKKGLNCLKQLICAVANSIKRNHPLKSSAAPFQGSPNPSQKLSSFSFSFSLLPTIGLISLSAFPQYLFVVLMLMAFSLFWYGCSTTFTYNKKGCIIKR